jgi:uncharacterized membrane protein
MGEQAPMMGSRRLRVVKDVNGRRYRHQRPGPFGRPGSRIGQFDPDAVGEIEAPPPRPGQVMGNSTTPPGGPAKWLSDAGEVRARCLTGRCPTTRGQEADHHRLRAGQPDAIHSPAADIQTRQTGMVILASMSASPVSPKGARASARIPAGGRGAPVTVESASLGWMQASALVLSVLGLVDSAYQTYTHFTGTGLAGCSATGDPCVLVQNSSYAHVLGIPVAVLGVAFYVFMVAICSPPAWRSRLAAIRWIRLASVVTGMIFVLYLVYAELIGVGRICPYCTSVHIITFLLFTLIVCQFVFHPFHPTAESPTGSRWKQSP